MDVREIASAIKVPCIISPEMSQAMTMWENLYVNDAEWQSGRVRPLKIPSVVTKELKRLIMKEFSVSVNDAVLDTAFSRFIPQLRRKLDFGLAVGGMMFKPYWDGTTRVDIVPQNQFLPIKFTDDACDSVACPETLTIGKTSYTRIEIHDYNRKNMTHKVTNHCFKSGNPSFVGVECSLSEVPEWSEMTTEKVFENVRQPLFSIFRTPDSNSIDTESPLGISVFSDAVGFIHDADIHWERILWELESSERAIDASEDLFRFKDGKPVLPKGRERMYHTYGKTGSNDNSIFNTFSPEIRDSSYFNAFNQIMRRIENACGLSYGFLSEVDSFEKTAEEIRSSKQRSHSRVCDIQENLRVSLGETLYGMKYLRDYYENRNGGDVKITCTFGDGVLEDTDKEFQRRLQMVTAGLLSKENFLAWYFGCDENETIKYLPKNERIFGGNANAFAL
ncbi:MAG: hypothetical protein K2J44_07815 [Ruminococcus sp.]|nr:hypothetical protein [Ruminococcus sp.]